MITKPRHNGRYVVGLADGSVQQLVYPADVLPFSMYDLRTDAPLATITLRARTRRSGVKGQAVEL